MINKNEIQNKTDEELVSLVLENQDYFLYIIERYKNKLFRYIARISSYKNEDIEDVLQEVFIKVYLNLNDFNTDLRFSSWIYRITHNQVISEHRKIQARPQFNNGEANDLELEMIISDFDIVKTLDINFLKENIFNVLDKIDLKYKEIIVLKFFEEKSYKEISDIIKKPMGTVASLMNKAKNEFKKELLKQEIKI